MKTPLAFRSLAVAATFMTLAVHPISHAQAAAPGYDGEPRVTLSGHVLDALGKASPAFDAQKVAQALDEPLSLTVVLRRTDPAGFEQYLHDVYDADSPQFRHFLDPVAVSDRFGPSAEDYAAVTDYFAQNGLTLAQGSANRMTLLLNGTRAGVDRALSVQIKDYRLGDKHFYANDVEPALPPALAQRVEAISGLSNLGRPTSNRQQLLTGSCAIGSVSSFTAVYFAPAIIPALIFDFLCIDFFIANLVFPETSVMSTSALAAKMLAPPRPGTRKSSPLAGATGAGQTIGLLEFDSFQLSDVRDYLALNGQPAANLANLSAVHINGGAPLGPDQSEVLIDIDVVMIAAPGAHVVVYDAPFDGRATSYQALFNAMINGGVTIISNSWASCEDQVSAADAQSIDTILATAAASGISVFNAAGDSGSTCLDGAANTVALPASAPHATAVGGSSLTMGRGQTYGSEKWWNGSADTPPTGQGGFGVSRFFARPAYQNAVNAQVMRSVPDVVAQADPAKGILLCQASAGGCPTGLFYGGTSMAAPEWAAFTALLNQAHGSNFGALNPQLYPLAGSTAFHTAAELSSNFAHVGLGSPNLGVLHRSLEGQTAGAPVPASSRVAAVLPAGLLRGGVHPVPADGVSIGGVLVLLNDANGNPVSGKTITLNANPGSHAAIISTSPVTSVANGAALFSVTDLTTETITFTATDSTDGFVLPQTLSMVFGVPPAAGAGLNVSPTSVPADGSSTTTITITLQDALARPTPGKQIAIAQGSGHAVISGPIPAVTDSNGQIQFTATDNVFETVTFTATDVSDGDLPIPGNGTVSFTGAGSSCVSNPPTAGPGFTLTPWSNGYVARNFFFGNVNWGGCGGASNPAFDTSGNAFVTDFPTGDLYKLGLNGGAVSPANRLSNQNPTFGGPVFGHDGQLYAAHGATTGNFTTGNIVQVDPVTGAIVRVVAGNLTCPGGLSVDPLSGDLFFVDACSGAGSDNPSLWRIHDPSGAATLTVYATLPNSANGGVAFAPNGTIYVVVGYFNNPQAPVVQVSGTGGPATPTIVTVAGLVSDYSIALGEANPDGSAKSLIIHDSATGPGGALVNVDISTTPFTRTILANGALNAGVIGPDGCMYSGASDTIFKLSPSSGGCGFNPSNPSPTLTLAPDAVTPSPAQGATQTFTASFKNLAVPAGTQVFFHVTGANQQLRLGQTDALGTATVLYTGMKTGNDTVVATATVSGTDYSSNPAHVSWTAGKHVSFVGLNLSPGNGTAGQPVTLTASLSDASMSPSGAIAGATVQFTLGGQTCSGITDGAGRARCSVLLRTAGQQTLTAIYAGSPAYTPAAAAQGFEVSPIQSAGLVYAAVTPCRIVDTRSAGGPIIAGSSRQFYFYNDVAGYSWSAQGGTPGTAASSCPGTTLNSAGGTLGALAPQAAVVTITDVNASASGNFVVWGGGGAVPTVSALNWTGAGVVVANTTLIPGGGRNGTLDFEVRYNGPTGQADLVADVVGYIYPSTATDLQCVTQVATGTGSQVAGSSFKLSFPSCATGYAAVNFGCASSGGLAADVFLQEIAPTAGRCGWFNGSGATVDASLYRAETSCCRLPGSL